MAPCISVCSEAEGTTAFHYLLHCNVPSFATTFLFCLFFLKNIFKHQYWRSAPARRSAEDKSRDFKEAAAELIPFKKKKKKSAQKWKWKFFLTERPPRISFGEFVSSFNSTDERREKSAQCLPEPREPRLFLWNCCCCCCWDWQHFWTEALQVNKLCLFINCQPESGLLQKLELMQVYRYAAVLHSLEAQNSFRHCRRL